MAGGECSGRFHLPAEADTSEAQKGPEKDPEGTRRGQKESKGPRRKRKDHEGAQKGPKGMEGNLETGISPAAGVAEAKVNQKQSEAIRSNQKHSPAAGVAEAKARAVEEGCDLARSRGATVQGAEGGAAEIRGDRGGDHGVCQRYKGLREGLLRRHVVIRGNQR